MMNPQLDVSAMPAKAMAPETFAYRFQTLMDNIERVIHGKPEAVRSALICLVAGGHLLIEDLPGSAKTSLAKSVAQSIGKAEFKRIQFTPDLLPSDIIGATIYRQHADDMDFKPGPIFANILLGDEINRAAPKTQSAMLEAMAERQVTVFGTTHKLAEPFVFIATQNPAEHQGTFPLPESQLDRFMMSISIGYPQHDDEISVLADGLAGRQPEDLPSPVGLADVLEMIEHVRTVRVAYSVQDYIVQLAAGTRGRQDVQMGVSPRGTVALGRAAQARAAAAGRDHVLPDDVKALAVPVFQHRIILTGEARARRRRPRDIVNDVVATTPVQVLAGTRR